MRSTSWTLLTICIATGGGWLGHITGIGAGWLLGSLIVTLLATLNGVPLRYSSLLQMIVIICVGVSIGSTLTPDTLHDLTRWLPSLAGLYVSIGVTLLCVIWYLRRFGHCENNTSILAAYPGHMVLVLQLAVQYPCDVQKVAIIQSLRMLFLVLVLPSLAHVWAPTAMTAVPTTTDYAALLQLFFTGIAGVAIALLLHAPSALLLGSITGSGLAAMGGVTIGALPNFLEITILVLTGAMIGTRFANTNTKAIVKILPVALMAVTATMLTSALIAFPLSIAIDIRFAQLLLAYAPGGAEVMSLIALATGHDPAFVGLHHIARLLAMAAFFPLLTKFAIR